MFKLQMQLIWKNGLPDLHKQLPQMPNIMELTLHDISLSELNPDLLPNLISLKLINGILDVDAYLFMTQFTRLMDIELVNSTIWTAHNKRSLIIKKGLMSGNFGLEYTQEMKQIKRLTVNYCSSMQCLLKDIKMSDQLLISNCNAKDLVQLPLTHLDECVLLNVFGDVNDLQQLLAKLPFKFYFNVHSETDNFTIHSQDHSFALIDIKSTDCVRSIRLNRGIVRISSKTNGTEVADMIPLLLTS